MLVAEITNSARITQPEILNTRPVLGAFSNDGLGATLAAWRRPEHGQLCTVSGHSRDRHGTTRFDPNVWVARAPPEGLGR